MRDPGNEVGIVCSSSKYPAFPYRRGWNYQVGGDVRKTITLNKICRIYRVVGVGEFLEKAIQWGTYVYFLEMDNSST